MHVTFTSSARPELRGTADAYGGSQTHPVSALVYTHDISSLKICGPTGGDGQDVCEKRTLFLRTIFVVVCDGGVVYIAGLVRPPIRPPTRTTTG